MIEELSNEPRVILEARLEPVTGSSFQPTGFPDLGPAEFDRPLKDGQSQKSLLVESVQSMANRLEDLAWDSATETPVAELADLPYIEVRDPEGRFLTSSRLEPHRLAGAYIKNAKLEGGERVGKWMTGQVGVEEGLPVDWESLYESVFDLDPMCLLHGVFFSDRHDWRDFGNPKIRRAITAMVEAHDVNRVVSGGVKRDDVNPTTGEDRGTTEGYGFVPFGRTEFTAREIVLSAVVDLEQIRGYGLDQDKTELLTLIGLWEIRSLLDSSMRFRTACDLEIKRNDGSEDLRVRRPEGWTLPSSDELLNRIASIDASVAGAAPRTFTFGS